MESRLLWQAGCRPTPLPDAVTELSVPSLLSVPACRPNIAGTRRLYKIKSTWRAKVA